MGKEPKGKEPSRAVGGAVADKQAEVLSIDFFVGLLGFALCFLWVCGFFLFDAGPLFHVASVPKDVCLLAYAVCCGALFCVTNVLSDSLSKPDRLRILLAAAVAAVVLYEVLFLTVLCVVFAAIATVALFQLWNGFLTRYTQIGPCMGIIAIFCGCGVALVAYLDPAASFVFSQSLPVISAAIVLLRFRSIVATWSFVAKAESSNRFTMTRGSIATVCVDGVLLGVSVYFAVFSNAGMTDRTRFLVVAITIVLLGAFFFIVMWKDRLSEGSLLKTYVLRTVPFLLALPFLQGAWVNVCACLLAFSAFLHLLFLVCASVERVRFNLLSALCMFGSAFGCLLLFVAVGWACVLAVEATGLGTAGSVVLMYVLAVALIACSTFLFQDSYPVESVEDEALIDLELEEEAVAAKPWRLAMRSIEEESSLSPRQVEVFELLARGRNCEFISEQFCISRATAKAHIYSIYRKIGAHSQQELINMVENAAKSYGTKAGRKRP